MSRWYDSARGEDFTPEPEIPDEDRICRDCGEFDDSGEGLAVSLGRWDDPVDFFRCPEAAAYVCDETSASGCPHFCLGRHGRGRIPALRDLALRAPANAGATRRGAA